MAVFKLILSATLLMSMLTVFGCEARKTHDELVEFATRVESSRPRKKKIENKFSALKQHEVKSHDDFNELGRKIAQIAIDIKVMIRPVKEMEPESEEVQKLRKEYLEVWTSLHEALRLTINAMATPDKQKSSRIMEQVMAKNRDYQAALQKFGTDYATIMNRYGIKKQELDIEPRAVPVSPSSYTETMPQQPGAAGVK